MQSFSTYIKSNRETFSEHPVAFSSQKKEKFSLESYVNIAVHIENMFYLVTFSVHLLERGVY